MRIYPANNNSLTKKVLFTWAYCVFAIILTGVFVKWHWSSWFTIPAMRPFVTSLLLDPGSTQFRNERFGKDGWLCGELNSKNRFGAYVGFKRYATVSKESAYLEKLGYVGDNRSTLDKVVIRGLDIEISRLEAINQARKSNSPAPPSMSSEEAEALAQSETFEQIWKEYCAQ